MKSLVALLAASLLVLVLLVITSNGTDKLLRSPSRGLSEDRALVQSAMASSVQSMADSAVLFFRESSKSNGKKGKTGKKAKKGKKGDKGEKGNKGNKGTTPQPTESPTPAPTPAPTLPCLDDITFPMALDAWFSDPTSATSTYGNITDW